MSDPKRLELKRRLLKMKLSQSAPLADEGNPMRAPGFENKVKAEAREARDATNLVSLEDVKTAQVAHSRRFAPDDQQGRVVKMQAQPAVNKVIDAVKAPPTVKAFARNTSPETQEYVNQTLDAPKEERTPWQDYSGLEKGLHVVDLATTRPFFAGAYEASIDPEKDFSFGDVFSGKLGQPRQIVESINKHGGPVDKTVKDALGFAGKVFPDAIDIGNRIAESGATPGPGAAIGAYVNSVKDKLKTPVADFDSAIGVSLVDPSVLISYGIKGAGPQFAQQANRFLRAAKLADKVDNAAFVAKAEKLMAGKGGTPQFAEGLSGLLDETVEEVAQSAALAARKEATAGIRGATSLEDFNITPEQAGRIKEAGERAYALAKANTGATTAKHAQNIFGTAGEYAGREGLSISAPFMPHKGVEVSELFSRMGINLPEQLGRRAVDALGDGFYKGLYKVAPGIAKFSSKAPRFATDGKRVDFHSRKWLKEEIRGAAHGARASVAEAMNDFVENVAPRMPDIPEERKGIVTSLMEGKFSSEEIPEIQALQSGLPIIEKSHVPKAFEFPELLGPRVVKEDGKHWLVTPDPETVQRIQSASPAEKEAVKAFSEWLDRRFKVLTDSGVLKKEQYSPNWATGYYFPRQWQTDVGPDQMAKLYPGQGATSLKQRAQGGGHAVSKDIHGAIAETDPFVASRKYAEQVERVRHKMQLSDAIGNLFGVDQKSISNAATVTKLGDKYVDNTIMNMLDDQVNQAFKPFLSTGMGKWAQVLNKPLSWFKEFNTVPNFRYHMTNQGGDLFLAWAGGMRSPEGMSIMSELMEGAADSKVLINGITAGEIRAAFKKSGIMGPGAVGGKLDIEHAGYAAAKEDVFRSQSTAHKAAKAGKSGFSPVSAGQEAKRVLKAKGGEYARDVATLGMRRAGRALAEKWDEFIKGSFAIDRLMKGDPLNLAISRTYEYLPDYLDQNALVKILRTVKPFGTWEGHMLQNIPKIIVRNPSTARATAKVMQASREEGDDAAPRYASEHGPTINFGEGLEGVVRGAASGIFGVDISEGFDIGAQIPDPILQTLGPYMGGGLDPIISGLRPELRILYEQTQGRDVLTKQPLGRSTPSSMFPAEFPGVPEALKTDTGDSEIEGPQIPWATRYVPEFTTSPITRLVANRVLQKVGGEGTSAQLLGRQTPDSPLSDNRFALQALSQFGALPTMYTTDPYTELQDKARDPAVIKAGTAKEDLKRALKRIILRRRLQSE